MELLIETLKTGGVILYPTDTIWGIGCDATNSQAIQKIFDIKKRDAKKSPIILVESEKRLQDLLPLFMITPKVSRRNFLPKMGALVFVW